MIRLMIGIIGAFSMLSADASIDDELAYCTVCHGAHGNGNLAIRAPKIAGLEPWYLKRQLEAFRVGIRGKHSDDVAGQEMQPVGVRLRDDAEIARVLKYVATFVPKAPALTVTGAIERGRVLYQSCAGCHGPSAQGNETIGAPALAARTDWYLLTQLTNYASGARGTDVRDTYGAQMRAAVAFLRDSQQMHDVIAYINTLR
jgi:cytochrome c553